MKRMIAPLFLVALLSGCVAVPYDGYTTYPSGALVSSGYYSQGASVYVEQAPVYVRPAPVYVGPPIHLHYSRSYGHRAPHHHGPRHGYDRGGHGRGGHDGHGGRGHRGHFRHR